MHYKKSRGRIEKRFLTRRRVVKILIVCGSGLGSSLMMEITMKKILGDLGVSGVEVEHTDLSSAKGMRADLYVGTRDIATQFQNFSGEMLALDNMLDKKYITQKLSEKLREMKILN